VEEKIANSDLHSMTLSDTVIDKIKNDVPLLVKEIMKNDLDKVILYGSCARGDFAMESDIDIAIIAHCNRLTAQKYGSALTDVSFELANRYLSAIVNFVCLPYDEYMEKKSWYSFYQNIDIDGEVLYG
jgi:predicted nucleotidyltransferase